MNLKLLRVLLINLLILTSSLSYSQKISIINNDTVVIFSKKQAQAVNDTFLAQKAIIKKLRAIKADTIKITNTVYNTKTDTVQIYNTKIDTIRIVNVRTEVVALKEREVILLEPKQQLQPESNRSIFVFVLIQMAIFVGLVVLNP
jgi:hypothetical protein